MEDGDISEMEVSASIKAAESNDLLNKMANYPDVEVTVIKNKNSTDCKTSDNSTKVNGESEKVNSCYSDDQEEFSSDDDALIIDEDIKNVECKPSVNNKRFRSPSPRVNFKGFKKRIIAKSHQSLKIVNEIKKFYLLDDKEDLLNHKEEETNKQGELNATITKDSITQCLVNDSDIKAGPKDNCTLTNQKLKKTLTAASTHIEPLKHKQHVTIPSLKSSGKRPIKKRPSQKLTEYAQYLGLQPAVKFKCVKCSESSFPSLSALNEHQRQCLVQPQSNTKTTSIGQSSTTSATIPSATVPASTSTNFRVTRKVFLCSSCGTYYENCNLFLHMREVHRRYICLYCLGMFSLPEKLSHHLVTKHNCSPNHYSSAEDFLSSYSESCFLVCCHCERVFSERDNFYEHVCAEKRIKLTDTSSCWSCGIKDSNTAHLPTCRANVDQSPSTSTHNNQKQTSKTIHPKSQKHKTIKSSQKTAIIAPAKHVTADNTATSVLPAAIENEDDKTGGHFLADMNFCKNITQENLDVNMSETNETTPLIDNTDLNENSTKDVTDMEICNNSDANEKTNDADCSENINEEITNPVDVKEEEEAEEKEQENELENNSFSENIAEMKNDENDIVPKENCIENEVTPEIEKNNSDSENPDPEMDNLKNKDTSEITATSPIAEENVDESQNIDNKDDSKNDDLEEAENSKEQICEKSDDESKEESNQKPVVEDTRKVPKVTLKLPPQGLIYSENESDDSEKLTMEVDANDDSDNDCDESLEHSKSLNECEKPVNGIEESEKNHSDLNQSDDDSFQVAGEEVSIIELELDQPLDKFKIEDLIKTCLIATIPTCIYCNHARKIAVNGKQLGLHAIAEHRFSATVNSITAEELIPKNFVQRIKEGLDEIEFVYFSLVEQEKVKEEINEDGLHVNTFKHSYECFQCRFVTAIHKELYLHNRKMHAKTILLCIMCKSNFYSYSELICHLCPGNYVLNSETKFRCCMCDSNNLPSAFRLMVHLRKKHHTCDVCLEGCHNQSKLSNHVWKHKLHHLCYRCGIAYRNKPDITKHLFWKHGTESVLCKKCLQKKWPHVYHFCVPPLSFVCEECNFIFSKAVFLKVHKRLHINEKPHACQEENCGETFISKKLLLKHEMKHREPLPIETCVEPVKQNDGIIKAENNVEEKTEKPDEKETAEATKEDSIVKEPGSPEKEETKQKSIIDVYDLPALNLSESDSDSEDEKPKDAIATEPLDEKSNVDEKPENLPNILPATNETVVNPIEEEQKPVPILDGIWDNFKNYQATIEKNILNTELSNKDGDTEKDEKLGDDIKIEESIPDINVILADHDYCLPQTTKDETDDIVMKNDETTGLDHDYCTVSTTKMTNSNQVSNSAPTENRPKTPDNTEKKKGKTAKKKSSSSSDSSSDSDSSSCTCGSNCSCSSSSGSSSSSSTSSDSDSSSSEGKRRIAARRERRKERAKRKKESETSHVTNTSAVDVVATEDPVAPIPPIEVPIQESDLETDETETDEDFYDEYPQRLVNKILAEKRNQLALLASVAPVSNGTILECSRPSTPSMPEESTTPKKKVKSKKRKKKSRSSTPKQEIQQRNIPDYLNHHSSPMQVQSVHSAAIVQPAVPSPLSIHSIPPTPQTPTVPPLSLTLPPKSQILSQNTPGSGSETETSVRSSKRRRVPNKFYGYSSDDDANEKPTVPPVLKWRKADLPTPPSHVTGSPQLVPPITIKNIPSPAPVVEPVRMAPVIIHHNEVQESDSETEEVQHRKSATESSDDNRNDDSDSDTGQLHISQPQAQIQTHSQLQLQSQSQSHPRPPSFPPGPHHSHSMAGFKQGERNENLYCYCQCPYDEVSEMIACDGKDCAIEWFHFECVGIMVPPKGKWFCPDCRKRNTQRSDFIQI